MKRHEEAFNFILRKFRELNYNVVYKLLNAKYYGVPQDRERVIIVGYHKKLGIEFVFQTCKTNKNFKRRHI